MSLLDIYKAKKLGVKTDSLFGTLLGQAMGDSGELVVESVPYAKRITADGANVASKCNDTIIGGSVAWNQLLKNGNFVDTYGWLSTRGTMSASDNVLSYTYTDVNTASDACRIERQSEFNVPANHVVFIGLESYNLNAKTTVKILYGSGSSIAINKSLPADEWTFVGTIAKVSSAVTRIGFSFMPTSAYSVGDVDKVRNFVCIDLTQLLGSTIADYIRTLEQGQAGKGVEYFRKLFSESYYAFNEESIQSVNASAHITKDANGNTIGNYALDESLTLRGLPKISDGKIYYDGDIYESNGKVIRKYGERAYQSGDSTDGSTMITDGTKTIYKLETQTIEYAEPFTNPQAVAAGGTEEYVDYSVEQGIRDVSIPVGHNTEYQVRS